MGCEWTYVPPVSSDCVGCLRTLRAALQRELELVKRVGREALERMQSHQALRAKVDSDVGGYACCRRVCSSVVARRST